MLLLCPVTLLCHVYISEANKSPVVLGSGKTLAFGIPVIHTILEWKSSSTKSVDDDNTEVPTQVLSLYLPESTKSGESTAEQDEMDRMIAEGEEDEGIEEQDQSDEDEHASGELNDNERLGCVKVIENAEFDFDQIAEAEETKTQPLLGLVLTPTRELAVQVKHHIDAISKFTGESVKFQNRLFVCYV